MCYGLAIFWSLKIQEEKETDIFGLKSSMNNFGLWNCRYKIVQSNLVGVSDGVVFISALKTTISSIQNCNFSEDYLPGFC
jgi:hypothetical protein